MEEMKGAAHARLRDAEYICTAFPEPTEGLMEELEEIRRMLNDATFKSEMRMVVSAMAREFSGTGHWYRCVNGHPFTVGECGMPMETAKCPCCGAGIGGRNHEAVAGVTHAHDIEETFAGMHL